MFIDFRFPIYSNNHAALFTAMHADVFGLSGQELYYEGNSREAVQSVNHCLEEKFMQPVAKFQQAYRVVRDERRLNPTHSTATAIDLITGGMSGPEQLSYCRALVTCGLIVGKEAFPKVFKDHLENVECVHGELEENLQALVPEGVTPHEINLACNTQMLMLSREDWLVRCWRNPKHNTSRGASQWPKEKLPDMPQVGRLRVMLGVLNSLATGKEGYRLS